MGCELLIYLKGVSTGLSIVVAVVASFLTYLLIFSGFELDRKDDRKEVIRDFFIIIGLMVFFFLLPSTEWWNAMIAKYQAAPL